MAGKFETYTGKNGKHYFKLKAGNGEPILQSQGYKAKADCQNGVESVRRNAKEEKRFEAKTATNGKHYFVLKATNGQVVGTSEMYNSPAGCKNGIASVQRNAPDAKVAEG